uniref:Uncharacterized protein n=1 Tax=Candidatus Kentrum sp. FW TaxID=2126338 RepID=A0A450S9P7_9GAMM|nr:MAG: hypothetical protein BECKFW1821B_GA0114236_100426 [Candidatus Kentron sp. FW]
MGTSENSTSYPQKIFVHENHEKTRKRNQRIPLVPKLLLPFPSLLSIPLPAGFLVIILVSRASAPREQPRPLEAGAWGPAKTLLLIHKRSLSTKITKRHEREISAFRSFLSSCFLSLPSYLSPCPQDFSSSSSSHAHPRQGNNRDLRKLELGDQRKLHFLSTKDLYPRKARKTRKKNQRTFRASLCPRKIFFRVLSCLSWTKIFREQSLRGPLFVPFVIFVDNSYFRCLPWTTSSASASSPSLR